MTQIKEESQQDLPIMHGPSGTLAAAGVVLGVLALALALLNGPVWPVDLRKGWDPPSLLAVNISFCSLFLGAGALYRVRRMTGQRVTRGAAIVAVLLGLAGPAIFSYSAAHLRRVLAEAEVGHVEEIVGACRGWAQRHGGQFPPSLGVLSTTKEEGMSLVKSEYNPQRPKDPFAGRSRGPWVFPALPTADVAKVDMESDYVYVGADLTNTMAASADGASLVVVFAKIPWDRVALSVGFADGHAALLPAEKIEAVRAACDAARGRVGLKPLVAESPPPTTTK